MFFKCMNKEDCKKLFYRLALKLHPDHGGSNDLMILLQESYEERLKWLEELNKAFKKENQFKEDKYSNVYENIPKQDEKLGIILEIKEYASTHKRFNLDYVHSLEDFLEEKGYLTSAQYNRLVKTYYAFKMNEK